MTPDEIRARREAAGMTPADLASELGQSVRTIGRWEKGESTPKRSDLIAIDVVLSEQVGAKPSPAARRKANKR